MLENGELGVCDGAMGGVVRIELDAGLAFTGLNIFAAELTSGFTVPCVLGVWLWVCNILCFKPANFKYKTETFQMNNECVVNESKDEKNIVESR